MNTNVRFFHKVPLVIIFVLSFMWFSSFADSANQDDSFSDDNPHNSIDCANCHSFSKEIQKTSSNKCLGCHTTLSHEINFQNIDYHDHPERKCVDCHSVHNPNLLKAGDLSFTYDFKSENAHNLCITCHQTTSSLENLSDGHREARKLYHSDFESKATMSPSQTCMVCHGVDYHDSGLEFSKSKMPVVNTHASHPYEIDLVRGRGNSNNHIKFEINPEINLFDNKVECQTCHSLNAENNFLLVSTENESIFCNSCHEHGQSNMDYARTP